MTGVFNLYSIVSTSARPSGSPILDGVPRDGAPDEDHPDDFIGFHLSSFQGRLEDYECISDPDSFGLPEGRSVGFYPAL